MGSLSATFMVLGVWLNGVYHNVCNYLSQAHLLFTSERNGCVWLIHESPGSTRDSDGCYLIATYPVSDEDQTGQSGSGCSQSLALRKVSLGKRSLLPSTTGHGLRFGFHLIIFALWHTKETQRKNSGKISLFSLWQCFIQLNSLRQLPGNLAEMNCIYSFFFFISSGVFDHYKESAGQYAVWQCNDPRCVSSFLQRIIRFLSQCCEWELQAVQGLRSMLWAWIRTQTY